MKVTRNRFRCKVSKMVDSKGIVDYFRIQYSTSTQIECGELQDKK